MKTPELNGTSCSLVAFTETNISDQYISWLNDPEVVKYSENRHSTMTREKSLSYLNIMRDQGHFFWAILAKKFDNRHVGNVTVYVDRNNFIGNLAIIIGDHGVRGEGIGTEAAILVCDWILDEGCFRKITADTMAINKPMMNVVTAVGMHEEGRRKSHFLWNKDKVDLVLSAKFAKNIK